MNYKIPFLKLRGGVLLYKMDVKKDIMDPDCISINVPGLLTLL
jgi:hypothetical protein